MRNALSYVIGLSLALWLGGLVMLFVALISVFQYDKANGTGMGPHVGVVLFQRFEPYQLALAAIAIAAGIGWRVGACTRMKKALLACLLGATILSMVSFGYVTPKIIAMWQQKQDLDRDRLLAELEMTTQPTTSTFDQAAFDKLHGTSQYLYTGCAVLVLLAGGAFVSAVREDATSRVAGGSMKG